VTLIIDGINSGGHSMATDALRQVPRRFTIALHASPEVQSRAKWPKPKLLGPSMSWRVVLGLLLVASVITACDQDPFGRSERVISGNYRLKQWEDETYWVVSSRIDPIGPVIRLGWDAHRIIVEEQADDNVHWFKVVDTESNTVSAPLAELGPEVKTIALITAEQVWAKLAR
jgi:hypothetical protein